MSEHYCSSGLPVIMSRRERKPTKKISEDEQEPVAPVQRAPGGGRKPGQQAERKGKGRAWIARGFAAKSATLEPSPAQPSLPQPPPAPPAGAPALTASTTLPTHDSQAQPDPPPVDPDAGVTIYSRWECWHFRSRCSQQPDHFVL